VVFIDDIRNIEIVGYFGGKSQSASKRVSSWDGLRAFLPEARFPSHQLVLPPDDEYHPECQKGIGDIESLEESFNWATNLYKNGIVFVENDLRAYANPTRMGINGLQIRPNFSFG